MRTAPPAAQAQAQQPSAFGIDATARGTPAFQEPGAQTQEESGATVMQQSPFVPPPRSPFAPAAPQPLPAPGAAFVEESGATVMQQSPFAVPPAPPRSSAPIQLPDADLSSEPTSVKPDEGAATMIFSASAHAPAAAPPKVEESASTLIFDPKKHAALRAGSQAPVPAAPPAEGEPTVMLGGGKPTAMPSSAPRPVAKAEPSVDLSGEPTQDPRARRVPAMRPATHGLADEKPESTVTVTQPGAGSRDAPSRAAGPQMMILALMGVVAIAVAAKLIHGDSLPSTSDLRTVYPYGEGGRMPNGHTAPSMFDVEFTHVKAFDCHGEVCQQYHVVGKNGGFEMDMSVYQADGAWVIDPSTTIMR